jgi:hypothetical protein
MDTPWMVPFPIDPRMDEKWGVENDGLIPETEITPNPDAGEIAPLELPFEDNRGYDYDALAEAELTEEQKMAPEPPDEFKIS